MSKKHGREDRGTERDASLDRWSEMVTGKARSMRRLLSRITVQQANIVKKLR